MSKPDIKCTGCGTPVGWLEVFPGDECVTCYAKTAPVPTAKDIVTMWGGKWKG